MGQRRGISKGDECSFPSQEFEAIVQPGRGDQGTVHMMTSQKETYVLIPASSNMASTPTPFVTSNTPLTVFSLVYKMIRSPPWVFASSPPWHPSTSCQRQWRLSILDGTSTESSSSGVDESRVALLDFVRLVYERGDGRCLRGTGSSDSGVELELRGDKVIDSGCDQSNLNF